MNRRLICLLMTIVLVNSIDQSSAGCFSRKEKPLLTIQDLSKVPLRYNHEQLFKKLGFSIQFPDLHLKNVGADLAATKDKDKPNVLANKYSIGDLLDFRKVYKSDLTVERFHERLDFCESLSPKRAAEKPKSDYVLGLIESNKYIEGYRHDYYEDEVRKPQEFAFYKNLHDYCKFIFGKYVNFMRDEYKLEDGELDEKAVKLGKEVDDFYWANRKKYPDESLGEHPDPIPILLADFTKTKQPNEAAEIKPICSEFVKRIAFLSEFKGGSRKSIPFRYKPIYRYCNAEPWKSS